MLAGVPMIVSDIDPLLEATGDGKYARAFPVGNDRVLGETIGELLSDNEGRRELAAAAKIFAWENFSIDSHMRELVKLYGPLLGD
jgi:glycosyltransferase involved in cell wall biosynthesis